MIEPPVSLPLHLFSKSLLHLETGLWVLCFFKKSLCTAGRLLLLVCSCRCLQLALRDISLHFTPATYLRLNHSNHIAVVSVPGRRVVTNHHETLLVCSPAPLRAPVDCSRRILLASLIHPGSRSLVVSSRKSNCRKNWHRNSVPIRILERSAASQFAAIVFLRSWNYFPRWIPPSTSILLFSRDR